MIDTSGDYGTQPGIGTAIRRSGLDRREIYLVTKVEEHDDAYEATRRNLNELDLDHAASGARSAGTPRCSSTAASAAS